MKKNATLGILVILFVFMLTGCGEKYSYKETEIQATVIQCEQGTFHPDSYYYSLANMYLSQKDYGMWNMYLTLANSNGKYDYNVIISINESNFTVVRSELYVVGQTITVTEVKTYNSNELVKIEYK